MASGLRGGGGRWGPCLAKGRALRASPFSAHFTAGGLCAVRVPWAKPFAFHGCAHRARTARLRAHGPMAWPLAIQWRVAFGAGEAGGGAGPSRGASRRGPSRANGRARALQMARVQTVLQCAPRARTKGTPLPLPPAGRCAPMECHWHAKKISKTPLRMVRGFDTIWALSSTRGFWVVRRCLGTRLAVTPKS